jgi:hypothetical protein
MPARVTKQTPTQRQLASDTVRPQDNGLQHVGIKLNIYGRGKTGKTRLACSFPKPMLLIGTEDGTRSVCTDKRAKPQKGIYELLIGGKPTGVDFVRIENSQEIDGLVRMAGYQSYGLDNAGGLQDIILKEILGLSDIPIQKSWGMAERSHWMTCGAQTKERLRSIIDLADQHGKNVVIIAHERNFDDSGNRSEVTIPSIGSALTPVAAIWLNGACDYVCQTFIREKTEQHTSKIAGQDVVINTRTDKHEYCLRTGPDSVYMTGFRLPPEAKLPSVIVDPTYEKILRISQGYGE